MKHKTLHRIFTGIITLLLITASVQAAVDLLPGAKLEISKLDENRNPGPWAESLQLTKADEFGCRIQFDVANPSDFISLTLHQSDRITEWTLNGAPVPFPLKRMRYQVVHGIPVDLLKPGRNELIGKTEYTVRKKKKFAQKPGEPKETSAKSIGIKLQAEQAEDLSLHTGPVLGFAGTTHLTISGRLNLPAEVQLTIGDQTLTSPSGLFHQFRVEGLTPDSAYTYQLKGRTSANVPWKPLCEPSTARTYPTGEKWSFVAMGDGRGNPEKWGQISKAVAELNPLLCAYSGDMVGAGRSDAQWNKQLFDPAKPFFSTVPFYPVMGNHEGNAALFNRIFATANNKTTWTQQIGTVLLLGIDGTKDWSNGSANIQWLEETLAKSTAKYIFALTHYPAWSSGGHGKSDANGPVERQMRESQQVILPVLAKYNATAMIGGHDHHYERSEPPEGVSVIVSGGAGAGLRKIKRPNPKQNPHSKLILAEYHYCHITIDEETCTMMVYTPEGKNLDTRVWPARTIKNQQASL